MNKIKFYCIYNINLLQTIWFDKPNRFAYSSGTVHHWDMFQYAKQTGGTPLNAHIQEITLTLLQREIWRKIGVAFFLIWFDLILTTTSSKDQIYKEKIIETGSEK